MSIRAYRDIHRRKSRQIMVGKVPVGGDAPITVQTMTNTITGDARATIDQIRKVEEAGADIVRVSCPDEESTAALKHIVKQVKVPIVADIHFHYKRAIEAAEAGAACLRINPGNIGSAERVKEVVKAAKDHGCSIRIGVNAGSLEKELLERFGEPCPEAMVESALNHIRILEDNDFFNTKISCKASDVFLAVAAYNALAEACDYPLHLGITEAGGLRGGTVKSSIGMGSLLWAGIGDSLYGFRVYPIAPLKAIMQRQTWMRRFDFDPEAAVRLCWAGVRPIQIEAPVRYFGADEGGVSHFNYVRDNLLLAGMHLRLVSGFALRLPRLIGRRLLP